MSHFNDAYIEIRIRRNTAIAVIVSLLVHLLILFYLSHQDLLNQKTPADVDQTLDVQLQQPSSARAAPPPAASLPPPPRRTQQLPLPKQKVLALPLPVPPRAIPDAVPLPPPVANNSAPPANVAPPEPEQQFTDMASYVKAARERRRQAGQAPDLLNAEAIAHEREQEEARVANLKNKASDPGTNGVFSILSLNNRNATIAFRGWKNEFSYSHREVYDIAAGRDGDIQRAVIRKMIEIIRRYYSGDFNWESIRLNRVIVLSARLQDNDGLEDFLLQEFFNRRADPLG